MIEFRDGRPYGARDETAKDGYYMTAKEFAAKHGVSEALVRQWKRRGMIDAVNYNGHLYVGAKTQIRWTRRDKKEGK